MTASSPFRSGGFEKKAPDGVIHLSSAEAFDLGVRAMCKLG